jgi:hypothetical protein
VALQILATAACVALTVEGLIRSELSTVVIGLKGTTALLEVGSVTVSSSQLCKEMMEKKVMRKKAKFGL